MQQPLKAGDLAMFINGARGLMSPNLGRVVTVGQHQGEHSRFGRIVRVHSEGLEHYDGSIVSELDAAVAWLKKIDPPTGADAHEKKELVTADQ